MNRNSQLPFALDLKPEINCLMKNQQLTLVNVGNAVAKCLLISELARQTKSDFSRFFWLASSRNDEQLALAGKSFLTHHQFHILRPNCSLELFYNFLKHCLLPAKNGADIFLLENFEELSQEFFPSKKAIKRGLITLKITEEYKIYDLFARLEKMGYSSATENQLKSGEFYRQGDSLFIFPPNEKECLRLEFFGNVLEKISYYDQVKKENKIFPGNFDFTTLSDDENYTEIKNLKPNNQQLQCLPVCFENDEQVILSEIIANIEHTILVHDDLEDGNFFPTRKTQQAIINFTTFPKNDEEFFHLNFFSVLPFYTVLDFSQEIKERFRREFEIVIMTKKIAEIKAIFKDKTIMWTEDLTEKAPSTVKIIEVKEDQFLPHSFQNNNRRILLLTDREIFHFNRSSKAKKTIQGLNLEMIQSLKPQDFVIHLDHGIGQFEGIVQRELLKNEMREFLQLKYAEGDKLYIPVESAEKVSKFIGDEAPKLTRLGSADWQNTQKKVKKEAARIAKDLLKLYAEREMEKGQPFNEDGEKMQQFCDDFPYELTPGQANSWNEVNFDMSQAKPMDRLVCGDVGFGKTEIAMRAAFKAFCNGHQAAILAPITILAEQHWQSFSKRIAGKNYGAKLALLSRFQSPAEQKKILKDLELGLVDIVIGTHRLLSPDVKFKKLGVLVVDEEQRFGVKQKEALKSIKAGLDILTLTATPIPRTLHMGLNKLKDISTITTPPPGRLPVVSEVRKYGINLIKERIEFELARGGQVYFLHNRVQTIESQAQQFRQLMPKVRFITAHGQMTPQELEERIRQFKEGEADVLIASTIIENGIDLSNANTLFVNFADKFGLSQLYQLRGRVGRGSSQAYAYFLYHGQKLEVDARKRLRAIIEASELGAGFQIAMKDLEIRGAGEILGASQSGSMKDVGVTHFLRMLHRTIEELKSGEIATSKQESDEQISVEIPLSSYIPATYIPTANEKIQVYQELAGAANLTQLMEIKQEIQEDYGKIPFNVENLCKVIQLKILLRDANLAGIKITRKSHKEHEITLRMGKNFSPEQILSLLKNTKWTWTIATTAIKISMENLPLTWYQDVVDNVKLLIPVKK